jgi:predicted Rossmann fold flavoprotein
MNIKYDIAVIGGGPAGMMAAGRAGELGARVVLLEKMNRLGTKLLITGKGRCNITNKVDSPREMIEVFGKNGKFLFSALNKFGVGEAIDFFSSLGLETKVERGNRVFPVSDKSKDVLAALVKYLDNNKVEIKTGAAVKEIVCRGKHLEKIRLFGGREIIADKFIVATGGKSYPATGSTGDGYTWLSRVGHTVSYLSPALVPILTKEKFVKNLEGLSLKNVEISVFAAGKKIDSRFGEALFTAQGMSGPIIIDISGKIGEILNSHPVLRVDFKPAIEFAELDERLRRDFDAAPKKMFKSYLEELLPQKLIPVILYLSGIDPRKRANAVSREERKKLLHLLKEFELTIAGLGDYDEAIITAGGIALNEVDPKIMQSKIIDNLYLAGEVLDLHGPTGGFNLQQCWSTGYAAGEGAAKT